MRHLTTAELLLYAEGELDQHELCQHVPDCVDCKAQLVDLQETYVHAANAIREQTAQHPVRPLQLQKLRERLAVEAELLADHLSTQDLLLSVEDGLNVDGRAHLARCTVCQDRAASLHLQLAEIEVELHRRIAFEFPEERRAAALAALRARLQHEVERQTARSFSVRDWLPSFTLPRLPAFASYSAAFAAVCLAAWLGIGGVAPGPVPALDSLARIEPPAAPALRPTALQEPTYLPQEAGSPDLQLAPELVEPPARFAWTADPLRSVPAAPVRLAWTPPAPALQQAARRVDSLSFELLAGPDLPVALPDAPAWTLPDPSATDTAAIPDEDSVESVVVGTWMLVRAGLWDQDVRAGGPRGRIHFVGSVATDRERLAAEKALAAFAEGQPVDFSIAVRNSPLAQAGDRLPAAMGLGQQPVGLVRNSLLEHYEDAARRSFREPDRSLLESELDRYVTGVLRHDTELLSHANALHSFLSQPGIEAARDSDRFRKVVRFHLDAIWSHQAGIHDLLSEGLPRRFWAYRGRSGDPGEMEGVEAESLALQEDALALDRALTSLLFGTGEGLDVRGRNLSINNLLKHLRQRTERLRDATRP